MQPLVLYAIALSIASVIGVHSLMDDSHRLEYRTALSEQPDKRSQTMVERQAQIYPVQQTTLHPRQDYLAVDRSAESNAQRQSAAREPSLRTPGSRSTEPVANYP